MRMHNVGILLLLVLSTQGRHYLIETDETGEEPVKPTDYGTASKTNRNRSGGYKKDKYGYEDKYGPPLGGTINAQEYINRMGPPATRQENMNVIKWIIEQIPNIPLNLIPEGLKVLKGLCGQFSWLVDVALKIIEQLTSTEFVTEGVTFTIPPPVTTTRPDDVVTRTTTEIIIDRMGDPGGDKSYGPYPKPEPANGDKSYGPYPEPVPGVYAGHQKKKGHNSYSPYKGDVEYDEPLLSPEAEEGYNHLMG